MNQYLAAAGIEHVVTQTLDADIGGDKQPVGVVLGVKLKQKSENSEDEPKISSGERNTYSQTRRRIDKFSPISFIFEGSTDELGPLYELQKVRISPNQRQHRTRALRRKSPKSLLSSTFRTVRYSNAKHQPSPKCTKP